MPKYTIERRYEVHVARDLTADSFEAAAALAVDLEFPHFIKGATPQTTFIDVIELAGVGVQEQW